MTTWLAMGIVVVMILGAFVLLSVALGELLRRFIKGPNRSLWWAGLFLCLGFAFSHALGWR